MYGYRPPPTLDGWMKDTLDHLPEHKQQELAKVVDVIRETIDDLEMVILFGSYARGDYKEKHDLKPDRWSGHISDYDILAVTCERTTAEDTTLSNQITEQCLKMELSTPVRLIMHDIEHVNIQLAESHYFFSDIKKEGCCLYNSSRFELSDQRELSQREQQRIAQDHYDHWFERANRFYRHFDLDIEEADYRGAAFHLHQAAEAAYKTILLVFTNYAQDQHLLRILEQRALEHHAPLADVFPRRTKEENARFEQLDLAYIGARYQPSWRITKEELEQLGPCVRQLLDITETICRARIQKL